MLKHTLLILFSIGCLAPVYSQNADQQVLSTSGDDATVGSTQITWTIGQVVVSSSSNNSIILNEGFQQGKVTTITLGSSSSEQVITIYPNPTTDYIQLQSSQNYGFGSYQLLSLKGRVLLDQPEADFSKENKIDMIDFVDGVYLLIIKTENQSIRQFKIIKN